MYFKTCKSIFSELWLAFYGGEATSTAPSVEEWSAQHLEMLKDIDLPGEEGTPPAAHRSQLFFLRSMLASGSEVPEERSGLQEALLNKLRSIAGVALGGSAIGNHLGHAHESVQEVHQHNYLEKNKATEPTGSPLPRSIVPIVGTRNPFCKFCRSVQMLEESALSHTTVHLEFSSLRLDFLQYWVSSGTY